MTPLALLPKGRSYEEKFWGAACVILSLDSLWLFGRFRRDLGLTEVKNRCDKRG